MGLDKNIKYDVRVIFGQLVLIMLQQFFKNYEMLIYFINY